MPLSHPSAPPSAARRLGPTLTCTAAGEYQPGSRVAEAMLTIVSDRWLRY
jgi:hypothetical protein